MSLCAFDGELLRFRAVDRHVAVGVNDRCRRDCFFKRPVGPIHEKGLDLSGIFNESNLVIRRVPAHENTVAVRCNVQINPSTVVRKNVKVEHFRVLRAQLFHEMKRAAWHDVDIVRVMGIQRGTYVDEGVR